MVAGAFLAPQLAVDAGRIIACLNKQRGQLTDACKKVLDAQK